MPPRRNGGWLRVSEPGDRGEQRVCLPGGTEAELATWFSRAVARAFDSALVAVMVLVAAAAGFLLGLSRDFSGSSAAWFAGSFGAAAYVVAAASEVVGIARKGQTIGKSTVGIRVVCVDGGGVSFGRSCLRWLVPAAVAAGGCIVVVTVFFPDEELSEFILGLVFYVPWLGLPTVWFLLVAAALHRGDRRGWHDRAAGTIVVQAEGGAKRR